MQAIKILLSLLFLLITIQPVSSGVSFDGVDDQVFYNGTPVTVTPMTLSIWFRGDDSTAEGTAMNIGSQSTVSYYAILIWSSNQVLCGVTDNVDAGAFAATTPWYQDRWHHAACTFNGDSSRYVFLDGVKSGENTLTEVGPSLTDVGIGGLRIIDFTNQIPFDGTLADARIYNRVLSDEEIELLYKSRSRRVLMDDSLVGYWALDDCADGEAVDGFQFLDMSVSNNHATGTDGADNLGLDCDSSGILTYP